MKIRTKLEELKTVKRPEVVEKIKVARSFGDLSENSEYDAAKDEQGFIEQDIQRIEHMLRYALIIEDNGDNNVIQIGKTVTFVLAMKKKAIKLLDLQKQMRLKEKFRMNLQWRNLLVKFK